MRKVVAAADGPEAEQLDSYVMVQRADVLDAIGTFVAAYLAELPEAQNLQPAQLQAALKTAFKVGRACMRSACAVMWLCCALMHACAVRAASSCMHQMPLSCTLEYAQMQACFILQGLVWCAPLQQPPHNINA